jgi:hypothetical protein
MISIVDGCLVRCGGLLASAGITGLLLIGATDGNTATHKLQMQYSIDYPN